MRILLLAMIVAGLAGCTHSTPPAPAAAETEMTAGKPVNKYCPINRGDEVDPNVTTVYKGKTIGFCCEDCVDIFKKDPDKYMAGLK